MKIIIITLLLFVFHRSFSQNCKGITMEINKFSGDTTYRSPLLLDVHFTLVKNELKEFYLSLQCIGSIASVGNKGVVILFSDNQRLEFPKAKIDCDVNSYGEGFIYSSFIKLKAEDIEILKNFLITDFQLYIFESKNIKPKQSEKFKEYLNCLLEK